MRTQHPSPKGAQPPICLLWPNGWIDENATWYVSRPWPRPHCIRRGLSYLQKGHSSPPLFGACLLWPRSPISATAELLSQAWIQYSNLGLTNNFYSCKINSLSLHNNVLRMIPVPNTLFTRYNRLSNWLTTGCTTSCIT